MRILLLLGWCMLPIGFYLYHEGPGQQHLQVDQVGRLVRKAADFAKRKQWREAEKLYSEALALLPDGHVAEQRRIRLERAKAQMFIKQLPIAHQELKGLVDELNADPQADPRLLSETREALANSQYYITWLMRLEGQPKAVWQPEIESARQTYRLLADMSTAAGDSKTAKRNREDLEATIRLARMDLSDLQGLPLPSQ